MYSGRDTLQKRDRIRVECRVGYHYNLLPRREVVYMMGASYKTKKELKGSIGQKLRYVETSFFGLEYKENGNFCVVGPSPEKRTWFASVTMKDGLIAKVS